MSDPENKKLKDLFNKKNTVSDDFEKEALEGFDLLENEQEAFELKSKLDAKINRELFEKKETRSPFYLLAAAAMALLIGLSAYFILSKGPELTEHKDLAISSPKESANPSIEQSFEAKAAELKSAPAEEKATLLSRKKTEAEPIVSRNQPEQQALAPVVYESEGSKDQEIQKENSAEKGKLEESNASADIVVAQPAKKTDQDDKVSGFANSNGPAGKSEAAREELKKAKAQRYAAEPAASSASPESVVSPPTENCYYKTGVNGLKKDLEKKLSAISLNRSFEAILFINEKKKVEKVEFKNTNGFSEEEIKEVTKSLKSLDKFDFHMEPEPNLYEFKLDYRPAK